MVRRAIDARRVFDGSFDAARFSRKKRSHNEKPPDFGRFG
jgi:hypothetical protein